MSIKYAQMEVSRMKSNLAFKCTYNNGGKSKTSYGYKGVCTDGIIDYNIKKAKAEWCSNKDCKCRQYYDKKIKRTELDAFYKKNGSVCYESQMFTQWIAEAGIDHNGQRSGTPRRIVNSEEGSLAVLTTLSPNMPEEDRRIFALFIIDDYFEGDEENEGYVASESKYKIELTPGETNDLKFWDFYRNENSEECRWGSGLFRYLKDEQAAQILKKLTEIKSDTNEEELAKEILKKFCKLHGIDISKISEPDGARIKNLYVAEGKGYKLEKLLTK